MIGAGILQRITEMRRKSIAEEGFALGADVPARRSVPLVPFIHKSLIICEIKRRSPSRGDIAEGLDPVAQAGRYQKQGIRSLSVLTEREHFSGSLSDLMAVKAAFPGLALLRKDFLLEEEDIDVSYRAGADAVLLIAGILSREKLAALYKRSSELGLTALVEVHNARELRTLREAGIWPELLGINARNLDNFQVDLLSPLVLRKEIDWPCDVVFESGIFAPAQVSLLVRNGFTGLLVGEAVLKQPGLAGSLGRALERALGGEEPSPASGVEFWSRIMEGKKDGPLVKICGIAELADARLAADLGADILGFIFAESPRRTNLALLKKVSRELDNINSKILRVAVLTTPPDSELRAAHAEGLIHAFQYHGDEDPQECLRRNLPFYKALRIKQKEDSHAIMDYPVPRVLVDTWSEGRAGGSGTRLEPELVRAAAAHKPLWLAGGLNAGNIFSVVKSFEPELVDVSSGLELEPGRKDAGKLRAFFGEINRAAV